MPYNDDHYRFDDDGNFASESEMREALNDGNLEELRNGNTYDRETGNEYYSDGTRR